MLFLVWLHPACSRKSFRHITNCAISRWLMRASRNWAMQLCCFCGFPCAAWDASSISPLIRPPKPFSINHVENWFGRHGSSFTWTFQKPDWEQCWAKNSIGGAHGTHTPSQARARHAHSISELLGLQREGASQPYCSSVAGWLACGLAECFLQSSILLLAPVVVQTGSFWNCTACSERPVTTVRYDNHMKAPGWGKPQSN